MDQIQSHHLVKLYISRPSRPSVPVVTLARIKRTVVCKGKPPTSSYPPGHPKAGSAIDGWLHVSVITDSDEPCDHEEYFKACRAVVNNLSDAQKLHSQITDDNQYAGVMKQWRGFLEHVALTAKVISKPNFAPFAKSYIYKTWLDTPGRGGNKRCCPGTRGKWATCLFKAAHVYFRFKYRFADGKKFRASIVPHWSFALKSMAKSAPLYRKTDAKFFVGERIQRAAYLKAFPATNPMSAIFYWSHCNNWQKCWLVDRWAYETLSRMNECLRTSLTSVSPNHQGAYRRQFESTIYRNEIEVGSPVDCSGLPGVVFHHDFQKNNACAAHKSVNSRVATHISDVIRKEDREHPLFRHCTSRKVLSILLGYDIKPSDTSLALGDIDSPLFPDDRMISLDEHGTEHLWHNVTIQQVQEWRVELYDGIIPNSPTCPALRKLSGHCWRGGRALELLALGVPHHIVAKLGRWRSIRVMIEYLATDTYSLIAYSLIRPSLATERNTYHGVAWYFANHRMFLGLDCFSAIESARKKLRKPFIIS